ncbi:MAG: LamG-like jellyroll fold domain-containing protein [Planctomycetia bacterium]|nr:LamG-like jellyroll fold domain-containing protein [Planctomycetia bacterium]
MKQRNIVGWILLALTGGGGVCGASPLEDAMAVWHFQDVRESVNPDRLLKVVGEVELNVPLEGEALAASQKRGGDGKVARFHGNGYLDAEGVDLWNLEGNEMTFYVRLQPGTIPGSVPIFSKHGGHAKMGYNLFAFEDYLGVEIGTTGNKAHREAQETAPLSGKAWFSEMRSPETASQRWHDVICRVNEAKMELFVDGRCVDEDFVLGKLKQNDVSLLFGAQDFGEGANGKFYGSLDTVAIWNRALTEEEIVSLCGGVEEIDTRQRTDRGNGENLQYWRPPNEYGVGDCMPFTHDGVFHLVYLLDKKRHGAKNGFGAHQWIQATSRDLIHWEHQPFVVPITRQNEGSICTGSIFYHEGIFYALYANRSLDAGGKLAYATSTDGIHFTKQQEPMVSLPEGYSGSLRDPVALYDSEDGLVHLYATTTYRGRGCWAHIVSQDMKNWQLRDPIYLHSHGEPECPDWFQWGDFFYTIAGYGSGLYRISEKATGPWRIPEGSNQLMRGILRVPKTAPWKEGRRIICGWTSQRGFGGDVVFHELVQRENGSLGEKFVPEMIPPTETPTVMEKNLQFREKTWEDLPPHYRLQAKITFVPEKINHLLDYTLTLAEGLEIRLIPTENRILAGNISLEGVDFSQGILTLDAIVIRDLCDLCFQECHTVTLAIPRQEKRSLTLRDTSEVLEKEVPLKRLEKLPQEQLPVRPGYVLESLRIAPLKPLPYSH